MHPLVGLSLSGNTLTPLDEPGAAAGQLGRPVWNARQLLSDLELRLGLPRGHVSRGLRVQQWSKRLERVVAEARDAPPYFAEAYRIDPTGTAAQLLRLRDGLVDAGWNGESLSGAERLVTLCRLAAFDDPPVPKGTADHLAAVGAELDRATSTPYVALDLVDELELWPGRWRRILARQKALGTRIEPLRPTWPAPAGESDLARFQHALRGERMGERPAAADGTLVLLRAATSSLLAEPTAALLAAELTSSTVVIRGLDPSPLDAALERQGLARQGVVGASRWRPALQVLRLALAVAFLPKDPRRVLELLTLGSGPFMGARVDAWRRCGAIARAWAARSGRRPQKSFRAALPSARGVELDGLARIAFRRRSLGDTRVRRAAQAAAFRCAPWAAVLFSRPHQGSRFPDPSRRSLRAVRTRTHSKQGPARYRWRSSRAPSATTARRPRRGNQQ